MILDLSQVSRTAILTLICRAVESERDNSGFKDPMAVLCLERLASMASAEDRRWILQKQRMYAGLNRRDARALIRRASAFDQIAGRFIQGHPNCTVINLACGFDTRFWRIENHHNSPFTAGGKCTFIELDLPEVITLKKALLKDHLDYELMTGSVLDTAWIDQVTASGNSDFLLLAEGLFMWFPEPEVARLFKAIDESFYGSQLVLDMVPQVWTRGLWKSLMRLHSRIEWGLDVSWVFGIKNPHDLEAYGHGLKVVGEEKGSAGPIITLSITQPEPGRAEPAANKPIDCRDMQRHRRIMRSEAEIFELILETARQDERIRAVVMNGSRANPNAPRDPFQDFDIVYIVKDVAPFRNNLEWIKRFGEIMIMQLPEDMQDPPPANDGGYGYLMQFTDGNRIDLGICPLEQVHEALQDSLTVVLLDRDGIIGPLPPAGERDYLPKPPAPKAFADCCNEFWWVCPYVAKGLWRRELPYARFMLDQVLRDPLMKMLAWYIGIQTGFSVNPGKFGKYFQKYLEPELWERFLESYSDADYDHTWAALKSMCTLFEEIAIPVAQHFGLVYPHDDAGRVSAHLEYVRRLPGDAREIY